MATHTKDLEIDKARQSNYLFKQWYHNLNARFEKQEQEIACLKAENIRLQEEKDKVSLSIDSISSFDAYLAHNNSASVNDDFEADELWEEAF